MSKTESYMIRLARSSDAVQLAKMSKSLIEHGLPWRWRAGRIMHHIRDPDSVVIVREDNDSTILGFAVMTFGIIQAHLNLLAVAEQRQRRGEGKALMEWLEASCAVAGIGRITLEVRNDNAKGIDFYRKQNFQVQSVREGYYEGVIDALAMTKRLIPEEMERNRP